MSNTSGIARWPRDANIPTNFENPHQRKKRKACDATERTFDGGRATAPDPDYTTRRTNSAPRRRFPVRPQVQRASSRDTQQTHPPAIDVGTGLGITNTTTDPPSYSLRPAPNENNNSTLNIAEWVEKRLLRHDSSNNILERWLLEIISWTLGFLCMTAYVAIALVLRDKKEPKWPLALVLSVLSRVASGALVLPTSEALGQLKWSWFQGRNSKKLWDFEIFDNASRGPTGSFMLLVRTKCKDLAALGAAVTLLSLALDPFFQQVVDYPQRWALQGKSTIPKVVRYEPRLTTLFSGSVKIAQQDEDLQAIAQKFFYDNGTQPVPFGNGTRADIPLSCPTSKCQWEPYESLGVCSQCADVSQLLTYACLTTQVDWVANTNGCGSRQCTYPNGTACGYFLNVTSNSPYLMSGYSIDSAASLANGSRSGEALIMRALPLITNPLKQPLFGSGSINFKHVRNPIIDFLIVGAADGSASSVYRNETPVAHECVLSWCVKKLRSSYYLANYEEKVVNYTLNTTVGPFPWDAVSVSQPSNGTLIVYNQNITINPPSSDENTPVDSYGLSNLTALQTAEIFDEMFPSFATAANASAIPWVRTAVGKKGLPMLRSLELNPWIPPNNVSGHVERLATALTNTLRSSDSSKSFFGTAYDKQTYVAVYFEWLSLPLALLLFSGIFLLATILKTSKGNDQIRKTSAIATLLYGLPNDMHEKLSTSTSVGTPRTKARNLKVRLLPNKHGWRVSGAQLAPGVPNFGRNQPPPGWI